MRPILLLLPFFTLGQFTPPSSAYRLSFSDARGSLGPPKFRDAKFQLASDTSLTIKVNY